MNNEDLLTKIKNYEDRILYLENELNETKTHLKKYTDNTKKYYENHKEEIKQKVKEYKEETKCRIFVNRDVNACKNILLLGKCYLESQTRPEEFTRKVIKSEKVKKPKKQTSKNK